MTDIYIVDKIFDSVDFTVTPFQKGDYENCDFIQCSFASVDISEVKFIDCRFSNSDLSLANIHKSSFRDAIFRDCKMLGLRFDTVNQFGLTFSFSGCQLNHSSFLSLKIPKTIFEDCKLIEVDFAESDLSGTSFAKSDLSGAVFENCNLESSDFREAHSFLINPQINKIKKAKFQLIGLPGLLANYNIVIET